MSEEQNKRSINKIVMYSYLDDGEVLALEIEKDRGVLTNMSNDAIKTVLTTLILDATRFIASDTPEEPRNPDAFVETQEN